MTAKHQYTIYLPRYVKGRSATDLLSIPAITQ